MAELREIPGLKAKLGAVRGRLGRLALARAFWPFFLFAGLYLAAALLGVFQFVPPTVAAGITICSFLVAALLLVRALRVWQRPGEAEARAGEPLDWEREGGARRGGRGRWEGWE